LTVVLRRVRAYVVIACTATPGEYQRAMGGDSQPLYAALMKTWRATPAEVAARQAAAAEASLSGPGDRCRLPHNDGDQSTFDASLARIWRVTKPLHLSFSTHRPTDHGSARLAPGDLLRYDDTSTFKQGCVHELQVTERFVVLTGTFAGHCVKTWGCWEPDRSSIEPMSGNDAQAS
jgi:hypothetical protein